VKTTTRRKVCRIVAHPLEGIALAAFRLTPSHDASSLASHLGGSSPAFVEVAADVLRNLEAQGKVRTDGVEGGTYSLVLKEFTLAEEAYIRRGCRACLKGLWVKLKDGRVVEVRASTWSETGKLLITVGEGRPYFSAELAWVVGDWPIGCCRPLLGRQREVLARKIGKPV
jgi:hypothetical protein